MLAANHIHILTYALLAKTTPHLTQHHTHRHAAMHARAPPPHASSSLATSAADSSPSDAARPPASRTPLDSWKEVRRIALPTLINTLIDPILSLIDTIFVGRLCSALALGATAAASEIFTLSFAFSLALRESASSTIARLSASGQSDTARTFALRSLALAVCTGLILGALVGSPATAPTWVGIMGAGPTSPLHAEALLYARVRALGLPFALLCSTMEGIFRGIGDTRSPLRAATLAAFINLALDPLLMAGPLRLGVAGAAAATVAAQGAACASLLYVLYQRLRDPRYLPPSARLLPPTSAPRVPAEENAITDADASAILKTTDSGSAQSLIATSCATLLRTCSILGAWVFITSQLSRRLGAAAISSHGVVLKVWLLFVLAAEAPAVAAQVMCARAIIRGKVRRARALLFRLLRLGTLLGLVSMSALLAISRPTAEFFLPSSPEIAKTASRLFKYAAASVPLVVPTMILESTLLGTGKSYAYLAGTTLLNAIAVGTFSSAALSGPRATPELAWVSVFLFFVLRLTTASIRMFGTARGGFGRWGLRRSLRRLLGIEMAPSRRTAS